MSLFFIVLVIYVIQCICWTSPRSTTFTLNLRGHGKRKRQGIVWNALDAAGVLANPFPPLTPLLAVQWPAFEFTADSIQFTGKEGEAVSVPWEKVQLSHSETKLLCNGSLAFKGSETQVLQYVELMGRLQKGGRAQREQIIQDWMRKMMSTETASRRLRIFVRRSRWLRIMANLQFVFLFLLAPLAFAELGTGIVWRLILMLAVISIAITIDFWMLHKKLFPKAGDHRFKSGLVIVFSPVAAMRACDALARDLLSGYHPVAVGAVVLPVEDFQDFAGEQLRLCRFGDYFDQHYQAALRKQMERTIKQQKVDLEDLMQAPQAQSGCIVYCPRCLSQFTKEREECSDCGYEGLTSFEGTVTRLT